LEAMGLNQAFWTGKRVLLTGHTGFKGSWLAIWLNMLGARVVGYSLDPPSEPSMFDSLNLAHGMESIRGDIRDREALQKAMDAHRPEIVLHMAAQSLVRRSYQSPLETFSTNVMGTVNLLDTVRFTDSVRVVVNVTSDKCYENREWIWGYRENESMGGYDPYSSSKGCAELVTAAYRRSYFNPEQFYRHGVAVASARAGNVIGGGDWAEDRLIPDIMRAFLNDDTVTIRSPHAVRPWQHVLEPLQGYLTLARHLYDDGTAFTGGWNFGPHDDDAKPVKWVVERMCEHWPGAKVDYLNVDAALHEARYLKLDCSKARNGLGWEPKWGLEQSLAETVGWYRAYKNGDDLRRLTEAQIEAYSS